MGVSSTKEDVHAAIEKADLGGLFPNAFCKINADFMTQDNHSKVIVQHEDGAGSKIVQNYLHYRETDDPSWFRSSAMDAAFMNTDDVICVGANSPMALSDTIDRNTHYIRGDVISEIISSFERTANLLRNRWGVPIKFTGGETADLVDQVRTITLNASITTIFLRRDVITGEDISPGDVIIGLESAGQATYEYEENSGIGSNGLTLARNGLMKRYYLKEYPRPRVLRMLSKAFATSDTSHGMTFMMISA